MQLTKRSFTIKKNPRVFSNIGIGQVNKQFNKDIKIDEEAIGLLDDYSLSRERWISGQLQSKFSKQVMMNYLQTNQCSTMKICPLFRALVKRTKTHLLKQFQKQKILFNRVEIVSSYYLITCSRQKLCKVQERSYRNRKSSF